MGNLGDSLGPRAAVQILEPRAQTDAWCPIVDNKAANYVRCGNVGTVCQKLTEFGALARQPLVCRCR